MGKQMISEGQRKKRKITIIALLALAVLFLGGGIILFMTQSYTISFHSDGGEILSNMKATRNAADLPVPVKPGYTFLGWSKSTTDETNFVTSTKQLKSTTELYAHWKETDFVINFYSEGELQKPLSYNEKNDFKFTSDVMLNGVYRDYWVLKPHAESGHYPITAGAPGIPAKPYGGFRGWKFKDLDGRDAWLWLNAPEFWMLESWDKSSAAYKSVRVSAENPFLPQLYDSTMHAEWEYRTIEKVNMLSEEGDFPGSPVTNNAKVFKYGETISAEGGESLCRSWYTNLEGSKILVGWKIGFYEVNNNNRSPLKINKEGGKNIAELNLATETGKNSDLSTAQLQRINELFDKIYPVSEDFYVDPLMAYLACQTGEGVFRTHTLYLYPVTETAGEGVSRYYDARFNLVTESGTVIRRANDGADIQFGLPPERALEEFVEYYYDVFDVSDPSAPKLLPEPGKVTKKDITDALAAQGPEGRGALRSTGNMHPKHATVFYEKWKKKDVTVTFDYGTAAKKNKKGFYDGGVRKLHEIDYENNQRVAKRYADAVQTDAIISKDDGISIKSGGVERSGGENKNNVITLPSASMFARPNANFIGWQEEVRQGMQPGRVYPAGYEYTISSELGTSYKMNAVWSDSTINFAFNLDGGRGFNPSDLSDLMRGKTGEYAKIPTTPPVRFGYIFDGWKSNLPDTENGGRQSYDGGDSIRIMENKQILTAQWKAKPVTVALNLEFEYYEESATSQESSKRFIISGLMTMNDLKFDQTVRLQSINPSSDLKNVKATEVTDKGQVISVRSVTDPQELAEIKASKEDNGLFNSLYRLVGWTFRSPSNANDPRAVTVGATQALNLNEKVVREYNGELRAEAFQAVETKTVELAFYEGSDGTLIPDKTLRPLINSFPLLKKSSYTDYIKNVMQMDKTHTFKGFFALPKGIESAPGFNWKNFTDSANGGYKPSVLLGKTIGILLQFFETGDGEFVAGISGKGTPQNFRITESMDLYLWLEPKPVTIEFYGFNKLPDNKWEVTQAPVGDKLASYYGDQRPEYYDLGNGTPTSGNLGRVQSDDEFFFLDWTVEYYVKDAAGQNEILLHTETKDLKLNAAGIPDDAYAAERLLSMDLTVPENFSGAAVVGTPICRIAIKPNMQSVNEFVVRIIDDGSLTGKSGTAFNVVMNKQNKTELLDGGKTYVGGQVTLTEEQILNTTLRQISPLWAEQWPKSVYGNWDLYGYDYWDINGVYVGPGSVENPLVPLWAFLDRASKTIQHFRRDRSAEQPYVLGGPTYTFGQTITLDILPTDDGVFNVHRGSVSIYPQFGEITYKVEIIGGVYEAEDQEVIDEIYNIGDEKVVYSVSTVGGNPITMNGPEVTLGTAAAINNENVHQTGYYFDEYADNLSTVNYLAPENQNIPRDQRKGMFKIEGGYQVGSQIPLPVGVYTTPKTIKLYVVWLPCDVTVRYVNTGEGPGSTLGDTYIVGDRISLLSEKPSSWTNPGYWLAGWSMNENESQPRFEAGQLQDILLSPDLETNPAAGILNVKHTTLNSDRYPHTLMLSLYSYWRETEALSVTFDFSPLQGDNATVELMPNNRFIRLPETGDNWTNNWVRVSDTQYKITGRFPYNKNISNVEFDWTMFNYYTDADGEDSKTFSGWYYTDSWGNDHDLKVSQNGQLILDRIFLAPMTPDGQQAIKQDIVIHAKWERDVSSFIQFNISDEAIEQTYEVTAVATAGDITVPVSVRNGASGDAEFLGQEDADNVPYKLAHNKYIGPAGKGPDGDGTYSLSMEPQFFRTEVAVATIGADGLPQIIVKSLNPMYEKLSGSPSWDVEKFGEDERTPVSVGTDLTRWETRHIPNWSASKMTEDHSFSALMNSRVTLYSTDTPELRNYAMFNGREGTPRAGTGFQIQNIYQTFVGGTANNIVPSATNRRDTRIGYELIGFAISDQYNSGVAFGSNAAADLGAGTPNTYTNNYMFSPRPWRISLVPIYKARSIQLTFRPGNFGEFPAASDVIYGDGDYSKGSETKQSIVLNTHYDAFLDLPFIETRGANKNPLLDTPAEWLSAWSFGSGANQKHAVFGDINNPPSGLLVTDRLVEASSFQVTHDPVAAGTNILTFNARTVAASRMEVNYRVLIPQKGVPMNLWQSEPLKVIPEAVNEAAGSSSAYSEYLAAFAGGNFLGEVGSVAEHYRKPVFKNGVYDYTRSAYTIPTAPSRILDSMFNITFNKTGLRTLGWFMEDPSRRGLDNKPVGPRIAPDPVTGYQNVAKSFDSSTGEYKYDYQYTGGLVDRVWQKDDGTGAWNIVNLSPDNGGARQSIYVYLIYDYVEGSVIFHGDSVNDGKEEFGKYGYNVALPTVSAPYGWTKDFALQRMRNYVQTVAQAELLDRESWGNNDFVKVEQGTNGMPAIYRKIGAPGSAGELKEVAVYKNYYEYDNTVQGGRVHMYAVWEERLVIHTFRDGMNTVRIRDDSSLYGLETDSVGVGNGIVNGVISEVKYFNNNVYGESGGINSTLPVPTKEGYKFLYWVDSTGLDALSTGGIGQPGVIPSFAYRDGVTTCLFPRDATLYAVWAPYFYEVVFEENNDVPGFEPSKWTTAANDILLANQGGAIAGGKIVTEFADISGIQPLKIPEYDAEAHFKWPDSNVSMEFLGWALNAADGTFVIDTSTDAETNNFKLLSFGKAGNAIDNNNVSVKVGILNKPAAGDALEYVGEPELIGNKYVRKVRLYALWNFGKVEVRYFDEDPQHELHSQDAFMLNAFRTDVGAGNRLVVPSLDNDYMEFGVMVADESIIGETRLNAMFNAKKSFGGWRVRRGPASQIGDIYFPGEFLDGVIRENIFLEAIWYDWHTTWSSLSSSDVTFNATGTACGAAVSEPGVLVVPGTPTLEANFWSTNTLNVTNSNVKNIIFPRMNGGSIGANRIIAHGVSRILLPSVDDLTVEAQAIHSCALMRLYIGDNLNIEGNPVAGKVTVSSTGEIKITSAMTAYRVKQGAQKFVPGTGSGTGISFAVDGSDYSDNPNDTNYLRGGNLNKQSTKFAYNRNFFGAEYSDDSMETLGALYNFDKDTLLAYPGAAKKISLFDSVNTIKSYAFAYMAKVLPSQELRTAVTGVATTVESKAVFHSNAQTIRMPSAAGSSIEPDSVSGYQPELRNVYFGSGWATTSNFAHVYNNILYYGASGTTEDLRTNAMYVLRHEVAADNSFTIPERVTDIQDYALSSFYAGTNTRNVTHLKVNANVDLTVAHFRGAGETKGQHSHYLTEMTIGGLVTSIDHGIFRGENNLAKLNLNAVDIALESDNYTIANNFPIFLPTTEMLNNYMTLHGSSWGMLKNIDGNYCLQTLSKTISYNAGLGTGTEPESPVSVDYDELFILPKNEFTAPAGMSFIGWRVTSVNMGPDANAINGKLYQPGWKFKVGMSNSLAALNNGIPGDGAEIYIQSSIVLTAEWAAKKLQFIDKDGNRIEDQGVLVQKETAPGSGVFELKKATNLELAGKKVDNTGVLTDDFNTLNFFLIGADLAPFNSHAGADLEDTYAFVGWIASSSANPREHWQWSNVNNINTRLIPDGFTPFAPDGITAGAINIHVTAETKYYHALYDISSGDNVRYTASGAINASASLPASEKNGTGNIGIPAAVIDSSVAGVMDPQGFMRRVTSIAAGGFKYMSPAKDAGGNYIMTGYNRSKVYIGGQVQQINESAFRGSEFITTVEFGHNYTAGMPNLTIDVCAFAEMGITSIKLPLVTTSIGSHAFVDNVALESVLFDTAGGGTVGNARLNFIDEYAFWGNSSLTSLFQLPADISIGARAFELTNISEFSSANGNIASNVADGRFFVSAYGDLLYRETASNIHLVLYAPGKTATSVGEEIFSGITRIESGAFAQNPVITVISIPVTVTVIEEAAFEYSFGIQSIILAHSVPSEIHGGSSPSYNPFSNISELAIVTVNATPAELAQWQGIAVYGATTFASSQG